MKKFFVLWAVIFSSHVLAAAISVVPNTVVEEQVTSASEKIYSFTVRQGEGVTFAFTPTLNSGSTAYYLYDNEQLKYPYAQSGYASNKETSLFDFKAAASGIYYLQVKPGGNGSYKLGLYNAWFNSNTTDADRAIHGSAYSAWELKNGTYSSVTATKYWYRFSAKAGTKFQIEITSNLNSGVFSATLYDGTPDSYGRWPSLTSVSSCCSSTTATRNLIFTPATSGVFYLETFQSGSGTLTLSATGIEAGTYSPATSTTTPATCPTTVQQGATSYAAGILKIPEVQVSDGLGGTLKYAVELEVVPLADPVIFKIKSATPKK